MFRHYSLLLVLLLSTACKHRASDDSSVLAVFGETGKRWGQFMYPRALTATTGNKLFIVDKSGRIQRFDGRGNFELGWRMPQVQHGKPVGLTVHPDGRLFVADTHYHRVQIFDQQGRSLGSFGVPGEGPGQFGLVTDVAVDRFGSIYVSEYGGNDRISKFSHKLQFIKTFGDAPVGGERLSRPAAMVIDARDELWVADACNHRIVHFNLEGRYLGSFGKVGTSPGMLRWPYDINMCSDGSLLVSEFGNNRLQWFDRSGRTLRLWGRPGRRAGELISPWGALEAPNGLVYVLDSKNDRVQILRL